MNIVIFLGLSNISHPIDAKYFETKHQSRHIKIWDIIEVYDLLGYYEGTEENLKKKKKKKTRMTNN